MTQRRIYCLFLLVGFSTLIACQKNIDRQSVTGGWKGYALNDGLQVRDLPTDSVGMQLNETGTYRFWGRGYYHEAGKWRIKQSYLYLLDTTQSNSRERAVQILSLQNDSLEIGMKVEDRFQTLYLTR